MTDTLTFTEEEKKMLFRFIKFLNKKHHQGELPLSREEFIFLDGKFMQLYKMIGL